MTGALVEIAGGLIGKQYAWTVHERAGNRHPLLLSTGKLGRIVPTPRSQAYRLKCGARALPGSAAALQLERQHHVFFRCQCGQQMERLENEPDQLAAQVCPRFFAQLFQRMTVEPDTAAVGSIQPGQQAEQSGLTGTGGADNGEAFA